MKPTTRLLVLSVCASFSLVLVDSSTAFSAEQPGGPMGQPALAVAPPSGREIPPNAKLPPDRVKPGPRLQMGIRGTEARRLTGEQAGLPRSVLPGAKFITSDEWAKMREIPKTGLFFVDADYVPGNLEQALKQEGFSVEQGGAVLLDRERKPKAMFILPQTYELSGRPGGRQGLLERAGKMASRALVGEAQAGSPYWFACYSAQAWLVYDNGFCRYQDLYTQGWAYGPKAGGGCGWPVPATRISSIETWAWILGIDFQDRSCTNCSTQSVKAHWGIGCFWPAYGSSSFENYANLRDNDPAHGNPRADAFWSWGH